MTCITKKILSEVKKDYVVASYFAKLMQEEESHIASLPDTETGIYDIELSAIARVKEDALKKMEEYKSKQ